MSGHFKRDLSVGTKLNLLVVVTTFLATLIVTVAGIRFDYDKSHEEVRHLLESHAKVLGTNNTASLVFDEPYSAVESLRALEVLDGMVLAIIFNDEGRVFARFGRNPEV